jgi:hypothetical protein
MGGGQWAHGTWRTHGDSELACTWSSHRGRLLHLASQQVHAAGVTSPSRPQSAAHPALWTPIPTAHESNFKLKYANQDLYGVTSAPGR